MADFKITRRDTGEIVRAPAYVHDSQGCAFTLRRATRAAVPGHAGRVIVRGTGGESERSAGAFGLSVSVAVPQHDSPVTGRWCAFSGCDSVTGACPLCDPA